MAAPGEGDRVALEPRTHNTWWEQTSDFKYSELQTPNIKDFQRNAKKRNRNSQKSNAVEEARRSCRKKCLWLHRQCPDELWFLKCNTYVVKFLRSYSYQKLYTCPKCTAQWTVTNWTHQCSDVFTFWSRNLKGGAPHKLLPLWPSTHSLPRITLILIQQRRFVLPVSVIYNLHKWNHTLCTIFIWFISFNIMLMKSSILLHAIAHSHCCIIFHCRNLPQSVYPLHCWAVTACSYRECAAVIRTSKCMCFGQSMPAFPLCQSTRPPAGRGRAECPTPLPTRAFSCLFHFSHSGGCTIVSLTYF